MDTVTSNESPEVKLHFLDYWRVIRLRRSLILVVFLCCVLTSTLLTLLLPPRYSSTVGIEVQKDAPVVSTRDGGYVNTSSDPFWLTSQFQIIKSMSILTNVIRDLNLQHEFAVKEGLGVDKMSPDDTYDYLYSMVNVEQRRLTDLIDITVRYSNAEMAAKIANSIVDSYRDYREAKYGSTHDAAVTLFSNELNQAELKLTDLRSKAESNRTTLRIPEMYVSGTQGAETIETEQIRNYERERIESEGDFREASNSWAIVEKIPTNELASALPEAIRISDPDLNLLFDRYVASKDAFSQAKTIYGPTNAEYLAKERVFDSAKHDYEEKIAGVLFGLHNRYNETEQIYETVTNEEQQAVHDFEANAAKYQPYYDTKELVTSQQRQVESMNTELIDLRVAQATPKDIVYVHDPARAEKRPVSPKGKIIIPIGIVLGLMVGIGLAFFIEYLDTSVKTIDDIERALQAPVLGVIPQNVGNLLDEGPDSTHAEAYRVLQTNLLFSRKNESWNTITVLSGGAGEGKSTTLFNLAAAFVQNGKRVLIVDSDLRRPSLHKHLHLSNSVGLTDLLLRQKTLDEVIQKTKYPNFDFLASGKLPSSSMSILGSPAMKEAIQDLKRRYELIFFDSPPLLGISDASILASEMDMVLQVVQYRRYPQPMTLRAKQMVLKVGGNLIGIVLNNINMSQDESYYYYSGYYEYQSQQKTPTVVQLSEAAKEANVDIKQKY